MSAGQTHPRGRGRRWTTSLATLLLTTLANLGRSNAAASRPVYSISIGQNEIPETLRTPDNEGLTPLQYADDDAAYFYGFARDLSRQAYLLTVMDTDTQRRFPDLAHDTRVPSHANLALVVAELKIAMEQDRAAGREPVLILFYSGHGVRDEMHAPGLALFDGALSQTWLYDEVLARLPARFVHLIIDACHAEAVVGPPHGQGQQEPISERDRQSYLTATTLARFPHVGALLASTAGAQSFEWDAYRGGVFAHEVLSALRGAADVNGDGRIEYSEVAAFVEAANQQIADARVRPQVVVQPPRSDRRAPIVDLADLGGGIRLSGRARGAWALPFFVETDEGLRVLDSHPEADAPISYRLSSERPLYVIFPDGEAAITPTAGQALDVATLPVAASQGRSRGSLESSMRKGLFATAYGPSFYRGFVGRQGDLIAVPLPSSGAGAGAGGDAPRAWSTRQRTGALLMGAGGAAAITAGLFGVLTWRAWSQYHDTLLERESTEAGARYQRYRLDTIVSASAAIALTSVGGALFYRFRRHTDSRRPVEGVAIAGPGLVVVRRF